MAHRLHEIPFKDLSAETRAWAETKIAQREKVLFCALGTSKSPCLVIVTDYKLIVTNGSYDEVSFPEEWQRGAYVVPLEEFAVAGHQRFNRNWAGFVIHRSHSRGAEGIFGGYSWVHCLVLYFRDEPLSKKFGAIAEKAITEANFRLRTPATSADDIPDIGDQLAKLAQLKKDGLLTDAEFEAAKRKLLG